MLTVTRNRIDPIINICEDFTSHNDDVLQHKPVLPRRHPVSWCHHYAPQEEVDTMIVQQVADVKGKKMIMSGCRRHGYLCSSASFLLPGGGITTSTCLDGLANS